MQKPIIVGCLAGCLYFIFLASHLESALVNFVLVGAIPGTSSSVSPSGMLLLYGVAATAVVLAVISPDLRRPTPSKPKSPSRRRLSRG